MSKDFNQGDRVKGLHSHKGKLGTIVSEYSAHATLRWDGGKRISTVEKYFLEALEATIMTKEFYWMMFDDERFLAYQEESENDDDNYEYEKIEDLTSIPIKSILTLLQSDAENANEHGLVDGYALLVLTMAEVLSEENTRKVLIGLVQKGGMFY